MTDQAEPLVALPARGPRNRVRREDILAVAAELFAAKGVASTTVRDIGAAAGVHSGSLYHYFPSKEAIAVELLRTFVSNLGDHFAAIAALPEPPLQRLRTMVHTTLTIINEHPHETRMFRQDYQYLQDRGVLGGLDPDLPVLRTHWVRVLDEGMADGSLRSDIPVDVVSRVIRDTLWATISWSRSAQVPTAQLGDYLVDMFLHGVAT
ncbi:TetR/AcrR family transcriptional regulator [Mycobacterium sp. NPDC049093]